MGFNLVGYGCTTCIGNSGPLPEAISEAITANDLVACSVLSGNRNFEGRVNPDVRANYLASPPLVVAYAIAGSLFVDITKEPLGIGSDGRDVYLRDIWPTTQEIAEIVRKTVTRDLFERRYSDVFRGDEHWQKIDVSGGLTYDWDDRSTYVQNPPYFEGMTMEPKPVTDIHGARILVPLPRFDHDRPHLAGRLDQGERPGRRLSRQPPGPPRGLQLLRRAPRQPRGHDARHLRQHPHQEPDGARRRRRHHQALSRPASSCRSTPRR